LRCWLLALPRQMLGSRPLSSTLKIARIILVRAIFYVRKD